MVVRCRNVIKEIYMNFKIRNSLIACAIIAQVGNVWAPKRASSPAPTPGSTTSFNAWLDGQKQQGVAKRDAINKLFDDKAVAVNKQFFTNLKQEIDAFKVWIDALKNVGPKVMVQIKPSDANSQAQNAQQVKALDTAYKTFFLSTYNRLLERYNSKKLEELPLVKKQLEQKYREFQEQVQAITALGNFRFEAGFLAQYAQVLTLLEALMNEYEEIRDYAKELGEKYPPAQSPIAKKYSALKSQLTVAQKVLQKRNELTDLLEVGDFDPVTAEALTKEFDILLNQAGILGIDVKGMRAALAAARKKVEEQRAAGAKKQQAAAEAVAAKSLQAQLLNLTESLEELKIKLARK